MPILRERSERRRGPPRCWLAVCGLLLGPVALLPLAPFAAPVTFRLGNRWLVAYVQSDVSPPQPLRVRGYSVGTGAHVWMISGGRLRYSVQLGSTVVYH